MLDRKRPVVRRIWILLEVSERSPRCRIMNTTPLLSSSSKPKCVEATFVEQCSTIQAYFYANLSCQRSAAPSLMERTFLFVALAKNLNNDIWKRKRLGWNISRICLPYCVLAMKTAINTYCTKITLFLKLFAQCSLVCKAGEIPRLRWLRLKFP